MKNVIEFVKGAIPLVLKGSVKYYAWMGFLSLVAVVGVGTWMKQVEVSLGLTGMRDPTSWGLYIANFTFLVGLAAAAVTLVIPAYVYKYKPFSQIVLLGELMAVAAICMCLMFVTFDLGRPERFWHLLPGLGVLNWPQSMLAWDVVVLNGYLFLNLFVAGSALWAYWKGEHPNYKILMPFILLSIPAAVSIHTVTAFLYTSAQGRPFWHVAVLAPRFIASAFCSGPSFIILAFLVLRNTTAIKISNDAINKMSEIIAWSMGVNLFLLGAELFTEFYAQTAHTVHAEYLFFGLDGFNDLVPLIRSAILMNLAAFVILLIPKLRKSIPLLVIACVFIFAGVWIEKGPGLVYTGFIPTPLGEVWSYHPTTPEILITFGVWAIGMIIFSVLVKVAIPIEVGSFRKVRDRIATDAG